MAGAANTGSKKFRIQNSPLRGRSQSARTRFDTFDDCAFNGAQAGPGGAKKGARAARILFWPFCPLRSEPQNANFSTVSRRRNSRLQPRPRAGRCAGRAFQIPLAAIQIWIGANRFLLRELL